MLDPDGRITGKLGARVIDLDAALDELSGLGVLSHGATFALAKSIRNRKETGDIGGRPAIRFSVPVDHGTVSLAGLPIAELPPLY